MRWYIVGSGLGTMIAARSSTSYYDGEIAGALSISS